MSNCNSFSNNWCNGLGGTLSNRFTQIAFPSGCASPCCPVPAPVITSPQTVCTQTPTVAGLGVPGATVILSVDCQNYSAVVGPNYEWQINITNPLPVNTGTLIRLQQFCQRQCSPKVCFFLNVETTTVAITFPVNGSTINTLTPLITGTSQPGNAITVLLDGVTYNTVTTSDGTWSVQVTTPLVSGSAYVLTATATGICGTAQASVGFNVLVP